MFITVSLQDQFSAGDTDVNGQTDQLGNDQNMKKSLVRQYQCGQDHCNQPIEQDRYPDTFNPPFMVLTCPHDSQDYHDEKSIGNTVYPLILTNRRITVILKNMGL